MNANDDLYSAVLISASQTSTAYENATSICPSFKNATSTYSMNNVYQVGCDQTFDALLVSAVTSSLQANLDYCDNYLSCVAVTWTGQGFPIAIMFIMSALGYIVGDVEVPRNTVCCAGCILLSAVTLRGKDNSAVEISWWSYLSDERRK